MWNLSRRILTKCAYLYTITNVALIELSYDCEIPTLEKQLKVMIQWPGKSYSLLSHQHVSEAEILKSNFDLFFNC